MTDAQKDHAALRLAAAVVDAIDGAGALGAPAGTLYAALLDKMSLDQFNQLISLLVSVGAIRAQGQHCYVATDKGRSLVRGASRVAA
jgi:hypothetical protein